MIILAKKAESWDSFGKIHDRLNGRGEELGHVRPALSVLWGLLHISIQRTSLEIQGKKNRIPLNKKKNIHFFYSIQQTSLKNMEKRMKFPKDKKNLILYAPFSKKAWRGEGGVKTWTQEPPFFHSDSMIAWKFLFWKMSWKFPIKISHIAKYCQEFNFCLNPLVYGSMIQQINLSFSFVYHLSGAVNIVVVFDSFLPHLPHRV